MAVLYAQHFVQFFDNDGAPLNGGKLYTYEAGTTTPKDTYTTAAGSTPNANPVVLDSAGRAVVFLTGSYKFRLETSSGTLVKETDNVTAFTTQDATVDDITANFTEDTIATDDSIIFSDVSDSGNTKRDTVQGILDLVPASSGSHVLLQTQSASASATINFVNGSGGAIINSTYKKYIIELIDIVPATDDVQLFFRTSTDGGSTYDAGASDYAWIHAGARAAASNNLVAGDIADSEVEMTASGATNGVGNAAGESLSGRITIYNPAGTSVNKLFDFDVSYMTAAGSGAIARISGTGTRLATADIDAVRFLFSSGNITSGTFKLYGVS